MRTASSDAGVRAGFDSVFDGAVTRPDRVASCQDAYGFTELRIRFVRDDYYVCKQPYLVEFAVVEMQCSECDNLKYPRLLNKHRGRVALRVPPLAVPAPAVTWMGRWASLGRRRRKISSRNIAGKWRVRSLSLSGTRINSASRFTRLSHSLMVGSSSRSSMAATLSDFSFIPIRVTPLQQHCTNDDSSSVQNRTPKGRREGHGLSENGLPENGLPFEAVNESLLIQ